MPRKKNDPEPEEQSEQKPPGECLEPLEDFVRLLGTSFSKNLRYE